MIEIICFTKNELKIAKFKFNGQIVNLTRQELSKIQ